MFGFLKKKKTAAANGYEMAKKLDGKHLRYVSERIDGQDYIIGKEGALILKGDELLVYASADVLFRAKVDNLDAAELMSLDGVVLEADDIEHGGTHRKVIAYYTYYR